MRREFTSNVSHELKTPLTSIYGVSDMLASGMVKPEDVKGFAGTIKEESARLISLIDDIMRLSQLDENTVIQEKGVIDLWEITQEAVMRLSRKAQENEVELKCVGTSAVMKGVDYIADEIVYNLCENAIKYNKKGGSMTVTVRSEADRCVLTVKDNGIGIPKGEQERIFERFYRVDKGRSRDMGGTGLGLAIGWAAGRLIERAHATAKDAQTIFLFAVAIVAYALPSYLGGNGFLAVYLAGIVLGASDITGKVEMAHFFDTLTEMAEMTIFFLLGLLVTPARLPQMLLPGLALMAFMLFVSRPIAVGVLLAPFKTNPCQVALVSWAGLRGAASVVFSLFAVVAGVPGGHDLFDLVFVIAVSSIVVQGSLLPAVAKKLDMIDATGDVRRTFNDYRDEDGMSFVKLKVGAGHPFAGRSLADIGSATDMLVVLVLRDGAHPVLPNGDTVIQEGDLLVMAAPTFEERAEVTLREVTVTPHGRLAGQRLRDVPQGKHPFIVVMLKREGQTIIPDGNTLIYAGDEAVIATMAS